MKKAILFIAMLVAATTAVRGQISYGAPNDWFVTVWDMSKPTNRTSDNPALTISVTIVGSNYTLYWEDVNNTAINGIVNVTSSSNWVPYYLTVPSAIGKYRLKAYRGAGTITGFISYNYSLGDYKRLIAVEQWGTTVWTSLSFEGCSNMDVTATDIPDLSVCQSLSRMFCGCESLVNTNGSITGWQTQNIKDMSSMFAKQWLGNDVPFNQPIGNWNTANVTNMERMFSGATAFNQPLSNWNTQSVINMQEMFSGATAFNQPIGNWNTANVTNMANMFSGATSFNQQLNWNTQNVTNMGSMFYGATAFNQPLNNWNTQSVTNMRGMFYSAAAFNQALNNWNTQSVIDMGYMFYGATAFNQDLSSWDVSKVTNMSGMFSGATAFNGNVNGWGNKMKNVTNIKSMFQGARAFNQSLEGWVLNSSLNRSNTEKVLLGSGMQCPNITATLNGWAKNSEFNPSTIGNTIEIDFSGVVYSRTARNIMRYLRQNKGINILEMGYYAQDCDGINFDQYMIKIDTRRDATGAATPTNRAININVVGTNFSVTYTDVSNPWNTGTIAGLNTGDAITLPSAGTYKISVFVPTGSASSTITKLSTTEAPLANGYIIDVVNWSNIKWQSLKDAFKGCTGLTHLSAVDVPNLSECASLEAMFQNCTGLTAVSSIEDWNLSNVTSLKSMFAGAIVFNQPLNHLNVSHITDFSGMFSGATAFDRPLGEWNLGGVTDGNTAMLNMFDNSGISCVSYKETLIGWNMKSSTPNNIRLGAANVNYGNGAATIRTNLQTNKSWTFVGDLLSAGCDGVDASGRYITVWDTRIPNSNGLLPLDIQTNICGNNVTIYWEEVGNTSNNGTITGLSGNNITVTGLPHAGVYRIKATIGSDPKLGFSWGTTDACRIVYVEQWGNTAWKNLNSAFGGAKNMRVLATDMPNLTQLVDALYNNVMQGMFQGCSSLTMVPSINSWSMPSGVKSIQSMFQGATSFNQDLSSFDISHITDMSDLFRGATLFNQDISGWDVSRVTNMGGMFAGTSFNQDITGWDVSSVINMSGMFEGAPFFNQPIGLWGNKMSNVIGISNMFTNASSFNQDLGAWNMGNGVNADGLFCGSAIDCENYSASLVGWAAKTFTLHGHFYPGECVIPLNAAGMAARAVLKSRGAYHIDKIAINYLLPDCKEDFYETTWSVPNTNTNGDTLTINAIGANFTVVWEAIDSTQYPPRYTAGIDTAANASPGHPYTLKNKYGQKVSVPGVVKVKVFPGNGTLTGLYMLGAHSGALLSVDHWGNNKWQRLDSAFAGCERMELKATDAPDLSEVTGASGLDGMFGLCGNMTDVHDKIGTWDVSKIKSMKGMFHTAGRFNRNINSWNVSAVTNMSGMFNNAYSFNQPLADWDVSKVTNMSGMFSHAAKFNQPIGGWDVSKVTDMRSMFDGATAFNKPLNDWNVSNVTSMHTMFNTATAFNQPLDRWDVRKSTSMGAMFYGATAFNQPLDNWKPFASTMMGEMFGYSGMSCENYSSTLYSWAQNVDSLKPNVYMTLQHNMKYGRIGKYARELIASKKNWQFADDTFDFSCSVIGKVIPSDFVTEWDMSIPPTTGTATSLRTSLYGLHFVVEYININDPTDKGIDTNVMASNISPYTITGLNPTGKYRVIAYKNPNIAGSTFGTLVEASDLRRLRKVTQWGTNRWSTMRHAFLMCANLDVTATDVPDLTNVTNMSLMFAMCDSLVYNSSIKDWDVSNVTDMQAMFQDDIKFNQPLSNWDTRNVTDMQHMFHGAHSFDQPLDNFRIDAITAMAYMFDDCGMGCENLSSTLDSWKTQAAALNKNSINLSPFGTTQYYNQTGQAAITALQARGWTITGGTYAANCITPTSWFTTVWDMSKPTYRTNDNPASTIAFTGIGSNYRLDWEDVDDPTNPAKHGTVTVTSSSAASPYYLAVPSGTTKVRIKVHKDSGTFDGYGSNKDFDRLIAIEQWGTTKWASLASSFSGCKNMDVTATDKPDLTGATQIDLSLMFQGCNSLTNSNGSMANWNTERVVKMQQMFAVSSFNVAIGGWNTSNVTSMGQMFSNDTVFNQPLNWNTEKVTDMGGMFFEAKAFNQPFGSNWKTHNVTIMSSMFMRATAFNQDISSWDTRKVIDMRSMFYQAYSFNQPLDSIKINSVSASGMNDMIYLSGINCENLSTTFASWATQATALGKNNVNLGNLSAIQLYNEAGLAAKNILKNTLNWTIHGGRLARGCVSPDSYVSEWDMSKTGAHPTELTTNLWGSGFVVEWVNTADDTDRGTISPATATTAPLTITGLTAGKRYRVIAYTTPLITGSILKKLATEDGGGVTRTDVARLDSVTQWGANKWMSLEGAFRHCSRMDVTATDKPDLTMLSGNKSLNFMFEGCENLVYNSTINNWVTTGVTDMSGMFSGAKAFNQPLDGWDVSSVKYMTSMFFKAEAFNQDLNSWQTGNVERMQDMFNRAKAFNGDIHSWNTGKVTNMQAMFYGAEAFSQGINGWDVSNVTDMSSMFQNAKSFTGGGAMYYKYGSWNVEKVTTMENMFAGAESFTEDLGQWTLRSITNMKNMFSAPAGKGMTCGDYSHSLHGWARNPHTNTGVDFTGQSNRVYNAIGKIARDSLMKPIANGGKNWTISGDSHDELCGMYVWTGAVSTDVADINNWLNGLQPWRQFGPGSSEIHSSVIISNTAVRDMHITRGTVTPPWTPGGPNQLEYWLFDNLINRTNKKIVVEPGANLYINFDVYGSSTPADADKIVVKADDTNPNGSLILGGQPCDKPVYATVEMYSKANREATAMTWTDNIPSSPTKDSLFSVHYRWQYIGIPVEGEYANAFYGSYLRKYDETYNDPNHYYGKWRKLGADETWQPLVPFAGYEVTSRTPKVYVFKGRLLHCPQELTLTRQAAEVSAVPSSFTDPRQRRWELGHNVFGNSYTSALNISNGKFFVDLEARYPIGQEPIEGTVYVYNTGSIADWAGGGTLGSGPGQYTAVPMHNATLLSEQYISSMQGFMLKFKEDTLRINGVGSPVKFRIGLTAPDFTGVYPFGGNQRPQRAPQAAPSDKIHGYLKVGLTSRRSVSSVHLIEAEGTTDEFDNGWDGMQLNTGRSSSATLFVPSEYGDLQVSTSDNIVGDRFGIFNNGDTTYRLTVIRHGLDNRGELYLYDVATNRYTLLDADTTVYDFTSEGSGNVDKRFVITDRRNADDPNTAVDEAAEDMSLYGYVDGRHTLVVNNHTAEAGTLTLLDVSGKVVYTSPFGVGFSRHDLSHFPAGVYIARLEASTRRATVKAITMK